MDIEKSSTALFVFRGQPAIHRGHITAVREMLDGRASKVLFVLGSTNVHDADNPISPEKRIELLKIVCDQEGWNAKSQVLGIEQMPDTHDVTWGQGILKILEWHNLAPAAVLARGNTQWTKDVLQGLGLQVFVGEETQRDEWQGNIIRKKMREGDQSWRAAYPDYLLPLVIGLQQEVIAMASKNSYCELKK